MDWGLLLEYGWVLLVLVALEGLLAADNALVLAIMVKHLPDEERKSVVLRISGGVRVPIRFAICHLLSGRYLASTSHRRDLFIIYRG